LRGTGPEERSTAIDALAREIGFDARYADEPAQGDTASLDAEPRFDDSRQFSDPMSDRTVHIDQHTGNILRRMLRYADYSLAKASDGGWGLRCTMALGAAERTGQ